MILKEKILNFREDLFAKNSLVLFSGTLVANILHYLFHLIIGRMVTVENYGKIESLVSLFHIVAVPVMTLSMVVIRFSAKCQAENNTKKNYFLLKYFNNRILVYSLPIFLVAFLITPWIANFLKISDFFPIILIWFFTFMSFFLAVNINIAVGWQKFMGVNIVYVIDGLVKLIFAVFFVMLGFQVSGAIGGFVAGSVASYIASTFILKFIYKNKKSFSKEKLDEKTISSLKKYTLPVLLGSVVINILGNADMIIAKHNLTDLSAGYYGVLFMLSKIIFFATSVIGTVLFSMSAKENYQKKNSFKIFKSAIKITLFMSVLATLVYFLFPKLIIFFTFGEKYYVVAKYVGWFAILATFYSLVNIIMQYLLSINKTRLMYGFLTVAVVFVFTLLFIGKNIYAILIITILTQIISFLLGGVYILKNKTDHKREL